jgi:serine/threonine-protein kinase HipA
MTTCLACLEELERDADYHPRCARELFGSRRIPSLDVDLGRLHTLALAMVGKTSLSGVQRKISLRLSSDRSTLQVASENGRFLLKPDAQTFPHLPANEHVTMLLAKQAGIEVPPLGLVRLADGTLAYLIVRFDRRGERKLRQEDFCQLAEQSPKERYEGSAELCARLVKQYASEPGIEAVKLFRQIVVAWWTGNGDMHLKNLSLLAGDDGLHRLSPAYDLLCTRLVIRHDQLSLSVGGKRDNLTRRMLLDYATYCGIPERPAQQVLQQIAETCDGARSLIDHSLLPDKMKETYRDLIQERGGRLVNPPTP